ncbi:MAG: PDZ domain-containing protein, partial [Pirellula staleyi]
GITIGHCSIYDTPRAGINIGDGCWGGHLIEFCDVFDTVKETGDHGSFNSWGRDRYWALDGLDLNDDQVWEANKELVTLDALKTTVIRNSRWRCDHGWDIDLDDGSSNYHIYNNLCLHGGLKNREGFYRVVENNVLINGFHPHVWYKHSQDVVRRNILWEDRYLPAGGMPKTPWGKEMDRNLAHRAGVTDPEPATKLAEQSQRDEHSMVADAQFVDADRGDFRVKEGSSAFKLGFVNFPMDQFGVKKPTLKAIARTPAISNAASPRRAAKNSSPTKQFSYAWQAKVRNISGLGDRSAFGLQDESGVLVLNVPDTSPAAKADLRKDDVIVRCNEQPVRTVTDLHKLRDLAAGKKLTLTITRRQKQMKVIVGDDLYVVTESAETADFKTVAVLPASAVLPVRVSAGGASTNNDPIESLTDTKVANSYGPVFANGVETGMLKLDLASVTNIAQINTFSALETRARQNFVLYGSKADADPGWSVDDPKFFTPIIAVDTRDGLAGPFAATSIRRSDGKPLGDFRWLVWAVAPVTSEHAENTAFQELRVVPMK